MSSCSKSFLKNYEASGILYGKKYSNTMPSLLLVFAPSGIRRVTVFLCLVWQPRSLNFWLSDILNGIPLAARRDDVLQAGGTAYLLWDPFTGKTISTKIQPEAHMSPNDGKHQTGARYTAVYSETTVETQVRREIKIAVNSDIFCWHLFLQLPGVPCSSLSFSTFLTSFSSSATFNTQSRGDMDGKTVK